MRGLSLTRGCEASPLLVDARPLPYSWMRGLSLTRGCQASPAARARSDAACTRSVAAGGSTKGNLPSTGSR
eukprot:597864-Pleurochrysis_carterae.AAC.1